MSEASMMDGGSRTPPAFAAKGVMACSALEQARQIREGTLRASELVEAYLERIARHDGALGAFACVTASAARRQAARADRRRAAGEPLGPFHGVPTAVKDHHMLRGTRTRLGSRAFDWLWSPVDDGVVKRLRRAGFVIVGKTTMSELGLLPVVETEVYPPTRNPWDPSRTAGGSSGGAGAAVAAGLLPLAPGSDGAGSVRIPAALNGLIGLKPSRGLVADGAERIDLFGLTAIGPMARSVDDAAALLDVLAGPAHARHLATSRQPLRRLRIGLVRDTSLGAVDPAIDALVLRAAARLGEAGHVVEARAAAAGTLDDFMPIYQRFISRIPVLAPWRMQPVVRWFWEAGRAVPAAEARRRYEHFVALGREMMDGLDVMMTPTVPIQAPAVGAFARLEPEAQFRALAPLGAFTALANVTGQPALTVPAGLVAGMPVGVQLIGHARRDAQLLALARLLVSGDEGSSG